MAEATKAEERDRQAKVSAILYSVEESIKKGNLDDALDKIRKVYQYDIKNLYARAFEERILVMIVERGEKELKEKYEQRHLLLKEEIDKKAQAEVTRKLAEYHRQWEEETTKRQTKEREERELELRARQVSLEEQKVEDEKEYAALKDENRDRIEQWERRMKEEVQSAIEQERARLNLELEARLAEMASAAPVPDQDGGDNGAAMQELIDQLEAEYAQKLELSQQQMERDVQAKLEAARITMHDEAFEKVRIENANVQDELRRQFEQEKINWIEQEQVKTRERLLEAYKTILVVTDVAVPRDRLDPLLSSLRGILDVSDTQHVQLQRSVQVNSYINTLRASWQKGKLTDEEEELLAHLCELYAISPEEQERLTKDVKHQLGLPEDVAPILAIDDSRDILVFVDHVLKKTFANIRTAGSVKEAVSKIDEEMPAVIICDVMMPEIGGFAFYDLIQKGEYGEDLKKVPFIFMSGCSDEYMKKIAEGLGVNKYLAKPFSKETLVKTVKELLERN